MNSEQLTINNENEQLVKAAIKRFCPLGDGGTEGGGIRFRVF